MDSIETPRGPTSPEMGCKAPKDRLAEPPTGRALWPTFMRRTLDEHMIGPGPAEASRGG